MGQARFKVFDHFVRQSPVSPCETPCDDAVQSRVKILEGVVASGESHEHEFVDAPRECAVKEVEVVFFREVYVPAKLKSR